jgi:hypothetical protein
VSDEDFIEETRKAMEESVSFFSSARKPERERWVVNEFLNNLGLRPNEDEIVSSQDEPPDVLFADARFEIKEIMDPGKRRHAEYKESLRRAQEAKTIADLMEEYSPRDITYTEICELVCNHIENIRPYAPSMKSRLDLLFYVNLADVHGYVSSALLPAANLKQHGWRSISFLAGPMAVVLYAAPTAPFFISSCQGHGQTKEKVTDLFLHEEKVTEE